MDGKPVSGDPSLNYEIDIVQERIPFRSWSPYSAWTMSHGYNPQKKKLKGKGRFFNTKRGYGIIEVISEIDENVPDRRRLIEEVLNNPEKPGLYCKYVSLT